MLKSSFKISNVRFWDSDFVLIPVLLSILLFTRILLILNAPFVYYFDSYGYIREAMDFASRGTIAVGVGMPFVLALGALLYVFESPLGFVVVSRLLMLAMSAVIVGLVYLLGSRMVGKAFGFLAALLALFEPFFLAYSIVPHDDVFTIAIGLTALYFASSNFRFGFVLAPLFFYLAVFTRPEFFLILIIPILIFTLGKALKNKSKKSLAKSVFIVGICIIPSLWIYTISGSYTRFSLFEKINLFLNPETLKFTLDSIFEFYGNAFLNNIFLAYLAIGVGLALMTIIGHFISFKMMGQSFLVKRKKEINIREMLLSDKALVSLCVFLLFLVDILALTVYAFGYRIVNGTVIITLSLPDRYLILPRLLISYPLVYPVTILLKRVRVQFGREK